MGIQWTDEMIRGSEVPANQAFIPPAEALEPYLKEIWSAGLLTNNGPLVRRLEAALREYLDVPHLFFVSSGTMALQLAVLALELKGEVITSPLSYVSAAASLVLANCKPVFADVDPATLDMDPDAIEALIGPETRAILPTHLYGNAAHVEEIQAIAQKHGLKVIYDAAHAFGVQYKDASILHWGDISALSTHAYKIFNTAEGGLVITGDDALAEKLYELRYFGQDRENRFVRPGINGKNSELHAAMGLCNLEWADRIQEDRKRIAEAYDRLLEGQPLSRPEVLTGAKGNHAYYPVIFPVEAELRKVQELLSKEGIGSKRYFYPAVNSLPFYGGGVSCPVAEDIASRILILPNHFGLSEGVIERIAGIVRKGLTE